MYAFILQLSTPGREYVMDEKILQCINMGYYAMDHYPMDYCMMWLHPHYGTNYLVSTQKHATIFPSMRVDMLLLFLIGGGRNDPIRFTPISKLDSSLESVLPLPHHRWCKNNMDDT
jgi:hypothetical protein